MDHVTTKYIPRCSNSSVCDMSLGIVECDRPNRTLFPVAWKEVL